MNIQDNLIRYVKAGDTLKPWLILGPLYEDVSRHIPGLTLFEGPGATTGANGLAEIVESAQAVLAGHPSEGAETEFRGQTGRWKLVRGPEQFLTWASWFPANHLAAAFLSTVVIPDQPGVRRWKLFTRIASYVTVTVNGESVFDTGIRPAVNMEGLDHSEFEFEATLLPGENIVTVGLFRMGRMARVGCRLEITDGDVTAQAPLGKGMSQQARLQIERELAGIRLERDILYPEHPVSLHLRVAPGSRLPLTVRLVSGTGETLREARPSSTGFFKLCEGNELADGAYQIQCAWEDESGRPLTASTCHIVKTTPTPPLVGYEHLKERKRRVLEHYADNRESRPIWSQVARYALGRYDEIDENAIREMCEFVIARNDCSDFVMQGILRLLYWERTQPHLSQPLKALMKETVLGFKYWVDEPGDTVMWMDSENHRILFHVAEWLAGQLYPLEEFTNSRQRGLYHADKGRTLAIEWMRERGRFGFDEWHSNTYYPACLVPMLNIYDFTLYEDHKFRLMAEMALDYLCFNLAADSFRGAFGTTHGRTYANDIKHPDLEGTSPVMWLLYGMGAVRQGSSGICPITLATSTYRLPKIFADIAADDTSVVESKIRQGFASKGWQGLWKNRDRFADFVVYRTPDYMLSGLQDHRKGEYEPAVHPAQVTLGNKAVIFWSCPYTTGEGGGLRPDYWSGNTSLPRVIQYRNVMSLTFRLNRHAWMSHCFFELARFDEVRLGGRWVFARVGQGYVGIYSQNGFEIGDDGQYALRELICTAPENTWLVECGREADWGSFGAFVKALKSAPIETNDGAIAYQSPSIGRFVTGWDTRPTVNDEPIQLHGYPLVDSPWAHSEFGSGRLLIRYGDETHEVWFD